MLIDTQSASQQVLGESTAGSGGEGGRAGAAGWELADLEGAASENYLGWCPGTAEALRTPAP